MVLNGEFLHHLVIVFSKESFMARFGLLNI